MSARVAIHICTAGRCISYPRLGIEERIENKAHPFEGPTDSLFLGRSNHIAMKNGPISRSKPFDGSPSPKLPFP